LFPGGAENEESVKHLANAWFMYAQGRPKNHGVYKHYAADDLEEMIAHFEHDLCDAAEKADADHLTRLAQAMYILKTPDYENIWWRIESRTNELASKGELTFYHATNILRAFSRSQQNRMCAHDKTFINLEKIVLDGLSEANGRDASQLMYSYAVRNAGNPELYSAFETKLANMKTSDLDYPTLFNAIYFMLFTQPQRDIRCENSEVEALKNEELWLKLVNAAIQVD
jgi:hypothetical protein